jgi:hypothetical protein
MAPGQRQIEAPGGSSGDSYNFVTIPTKSIGWWYRAKPKWGPKVRNTYRLPKRLPEGTKYVVESAGQFVRRFVELPNGRKIPLPSRKAQPCACGERISIVPEQAVDATKTLA